MSWWQRHRERIGDHWASKIDEFARDRANTKKKETEIRRRVGRYVLWCVSDDRSPAEPNDTLMHMYFEGTPKLEANEPMTRKTQCSVRKYVADWQQWLLR
jgi:hypothetical protein